MATKTRNRVKKFYDLQEIAFSGRAARVDRDKNVIRGVKLLGLESVNNATYKDSALASDYSLYEGADCFFDHPGNPTSPRGYGEKFGKIRGVSHKKGVGLFGDIHFNPKHNLAEQVLWDVENSPESVGMSPNHRVEATENSSGRKIVERIARVRSVDIVSNPATTQSLFEHEDEMRKPTLRSLLKLATPHGQKFVNLLEGDHGLDVTAPIDVLGDMKPAEAVADALAQTAVAIFMDETVSPEETGSKIAELAAIVQEVKAKVEPGGLGLAEPDSEEVVDEIEELANEDISSEETPEVPAEEAPAGEFPPEDAPPAEDAPAEDAPAEDAPAEEEDDEEKKKKKVNATESVIEKQIANLSKIVLRMDRREKARNFLESANVPVDGSKIAELMECKNESAMRDVMESWPGKRRGAARPNIRVNAIKPAEIPTDFRDLKRRYVSK